MTGKNLAEIYTELAYVRGSLRNEGGGWRFALANPPIPLAGMAEELFLQLDGEEVDSRRVWLHTGGGLRTATSVTRADPLAFAVGQELAVSVAGEPLAPGEHRVEIIIKPIGFGEIYTRFGFADAVAGAEPVLIARESFDRPVALTNGRAFVVANRAGDLSAGWTWFGLKNENGGLYMPPARFLRHLTFSAGLGSQVRRLLDATVEARLLPGRLEARAEPFPGLTVERTVFVPADGAEVVVRLRCSNAGGAPVALELAAEFAAALVPYGLLGVELRTVQVLADAAGIVRCDTPEVPYRVALGASLAPARVEAAAPGGRMVYALTLAAGGEVTLDFAVAGTVDGTDPAQALRGALTRAASLAVEACGPFRRALAGSYALESPDPVMNQAWAFARLALQQLTFRHPEIGAGICAGLPRFPNYWSRDSAWAGMGLLAAGETAVIRDLLANFFRHQLGADRAEAQAGDLPTVISGPAFMHWTGWGTSADGPLLILILLNEYVRQSGDLAFGAGQYGAVCRVLDWARRQDRDGDGYLEHGVQNGTTTSHAITIPDTTWMDHIDRRKSGVEIQGMFWQALRAAAELGERLAGAGGSGAAGPAGPAAEAGGTGATAPPEELRARAAAWRAEADAFETRFWQDYFPDGAPHPYDRLDPEGQPDPALRPNFAVNLLFAARLPAGAGARALDALFSPALRAPHGIRTLAADHPTYDPISYHHGCVWNLVTGWTAMAALSGGRTDQGFELVELMASNLIRDFGQAAELYRGDRREAYNGCFLQAWSVSVILQAIGRYVLGLWPDACARLLEVRPQLPGAWSRVGVRNVRVGAAELDLIIEPQAITVTNRGPDAVTVRWNGREAAVAPGETEVLS